MRHSFVFTCALALGGTVVLGGTPAAFAQPSNGAPAASAQSPSTSAPAAGTENAPSSGHHARHRRAAGETLEQITDQRIAQLHARLHITAQEEQQWQQFAQLMRDNARNLDQAYQDRAAGFQNMNAVENMESYAKIEQMRASDVQNLVPAFQTLYNSLSDQQKQEADRLFRNRTAVETQRHASSQASH
jgi:Skp family chaperone for outer membrane proteins